VTDAELHVGVMSGTSLDGLDVVLVDLAPDVPRVLAARTVPFEAALAEDLRALCAPGDDGLDRLASADVALAEATAAAILDLLADADTPPAAVRAVGSHGQTVRHRPRARPPFTVQIGDGAVIAERTGITTVCDFRRRDVAAGGEGAPLVPAFHRAVFSGSGDRVVVNIGGMANLTLLPAGGPTAGFDTGPGNVLIDGWARRHLLAEMDEGGRWAAQATIDPALLEILLEEPWFAAPPPKSTGREHFDLPWLDARLGETTRSPATVAATLTELTARTIADGITGLARLAPADVVVCGGGRRNDFLMERLAAQLPAAEVRTTDALGLDGDWVEAVAFAWLARERLAGRPGNVPAVTGAAGERLLGVVHPGAVPTA
jgi:anhydro-N-acetylmuramic acid kinase